MPFLEYADLAVENMCIKTKRQKMLLQMLDRYVSSLYSRMMVIYMVTVIHEYVPDYMNILNPTLDCSKI